MAIMKRLIFITTATILSFGCAEGGYVNDKGEDYDANAAQKELLSAERTDDEGLELFSELVGETIVDNCLSCHAKSKGNLARLSKKDDETNRDALFDYITDLDDTCDTELFFDFATDKKQHDGYKAAKELDQDDVADWLLGEEYCE